MKPFWRRGTYAKSVNISTMWQKVYDQLANAFTVRLSPGNPRFYDAFDVSANAIATVAVGGTTSAPTASSTPHFGAVEAIRPGELVRSNSAPSVRILWVANNGSDAVTVRIWHRLENNTYSFVETTGSLASGQEFLDDHCAYRPVFLQVTAHAGDGNLFIGPA